jgi:hypothetical protein
MANQLRVTAMMQRPNIQVKFPLVTDEFNTYQQTNYINTGKLVYKDVHISGDKLSKTMITTFASQADYDTYKTDATVRETRDARDQYCKDHVITFNLLYQEIDGSGNPVSSRVASVS